MLLWRFNWLTFLLSPLTRFWYPPELLKPPQPVTIEYITSGKVGCKLCLGLHSERTHLYHHIIIIIIIIVIIIIIIIIIIYSFYTKYTGKNP